MRRIKATTRKAPNKTAAKSLAAGVSKLFTQAGSPIPAAKLEPLVAAIVEIGEGFVISFTDELAEKLAERITEKVEGKLAGKVAEIRFPRS